MTKSLRKKHVQVWISLAFLLPAGIISGWLVRPVATVDKLQKPGITASLPIPIGSSERSNYTATIRTNQQHTQYQLEWVNKEEIALPSSLLYRLNKPENELIGRIEAKGIYHFAIKADTDFNIANYRVIIHDIIRHQTTDTLNFHP